MHAGPGIAVSRAARQASVACAISVGGYAAGRPQYAARNRAGAARAGRSSAAGICPPGAAGAKPFGGRVVADSVGRVGARGCVCAVVQADSG